MIYDIPGNDELSVSNLCEFYYKDGSVCELPVTNGLITIWMHGKIRQVQKIWVMHLAMWGITDPTAFDNVSFVDIIGKKSGFQTQVVFAEPRFWEHDKTYRIVPGYETVAVNCAGTVVDVSTGERLITPTYSGYKAVNVYDPIVKKKRTIAVHRLVALAWVRNKAPNVQWVVNHLNGRTLDNRYINLEWTTHQGNLQHAVDTGLRPEACPCRARNIKTGEVTEFPSIIQLRTFLGLNSGITGKTKASFRAIRANKLYNGLYEVRVGAEDTRPWSHGDTAANAESSRYIITIVDEGVTTVYNGTRPIVPRYKLWNIGSTGLSTILRVLKERRPDLTITVVDQYTTSPIEVLNIETDTVRVFPTMRGAERELGIPLSMIIDAVRSSGDKIMRGYRMRYQCDDPWPTTITENKHRPRRIEVVDKETQTVKIYDSLRAAALAHNTHRKMIKRHITSPHAKDRYIMQELAA